MQDRAAVKDLIVLQNISTVKDWVEWVVRVYFRKYGYTIGSREILYVAVVEYYKFSGNTVSSIGLFCAWIQSKQ